MAFISEDRMTITLPVPLNSTIYQVNTKCNDACLHQKEKFDKIFPPTEGVGGSERCSIHMPCHTEIHSIKPIEFKFTILDFVLRSWGVYYFASEEEAKKVTEEMIEKHKATLKELGLEI